MINFPCALWLCKEQTKEESISMFAGIHASTGMPLKDVSNYSKLLAHTNDLYNRTGFSEDTIKNFLVKESTRYCKNHTDKKFLDRKITDTSNYCCLCQYSADCYSNIRMNDEALLLYAMLDHTIPAISIQVDSENLNAFASWKKIYIGDELGEWPVVRLHSLIHSCIYSSEIYSQECNLDNLISVFDSSCGALYGKYAATYHHSFDEIVSAFHEALNSFIYNYKSVGKSQAEDLVDKLNQPYREVLKDFQEHEILPKKVPIKTRVLRDKHPKDIIEAFSRELSLDSLNDLAETFYMGSESEDMDKSIPGTDKKQNDAPDNPLEDAASVTDSVSDGTPPAETQADSPVSDTPRNENTDPSQSSDSSTPCDHNHADAATNGKGKIRAETDTSTLHDNEGDNPAAKTDSESDPTHGSADYDNSDHFFPDDLEYDPSYDSEIPDYPYEEDRAEITQLPESKEKNGNGEHNSQNKKRDVKPDKPVKNESTDPEPNGRHGAEKTDTSRSAKNATSESNPSSVKTDAEYDSESTSGSDPAAKDKDSSRDKAGNKTETVKNQAESTGVQAEFSGMDPFADYHEVRLEDVSNIIMVNAFNLPIFDVAMKKATSVCVEYCVQDMVSGLLIFDERSSKKYYISTKEKYGTLAYIFKNIPKIITCNLPLLMHYLEQNNIKCTTMVYSITVMYEQLLEKGQIIQTPDKIILKLLQDAKIPYKKGTSLTDIICAYPAAFELLTTKLSKKQLKNAHLFADFECALADSYAIENINTYHQTWDHKKAQVYHMAQKEDSPDTGKKNRSVIRYHLSLDHIDMKKCSNIYIAAIATLVRERVWHNFELRLSGLNGNGFDIDCHNVPRWKELDDVLWNVLKGVANRYAIPDVQILITKK